MTHRATLRRLAALLLAAVTLVLITTGPAAAYQPVNIVHTERVQAGPYDLTVGFTTWPIRAMQSLDFTFLPDGGITGKSGTLKINGPDRRATRRVQPLVRHPRKRDSWGLDVKSLNAPGDYSFTFAIDGPQGRGEGTLRGVRVLDQPGPPLPLSWALGLLPLAGLVIFLVVVWRRLRPAKLPLTI
ncbi:hypothetical protein [Nocardia vaccinii]|uniref:hypothetical protein n=1 Tax=Nocardia vaccinii TaxID=1822 RepID=UPI000AA947C6|nr:hypothetical protein [Nocardia vaccinii]